MMATKVKAKKKPRKMRWHAVAAVMAKRPVIGAEIGVDRGAMSKELFRRIPNLKLYMIDIWSDEAYQGAGNDSASEKGRKRYTQQWKNNMEAARRAVKKRNAVIIRGDSVENASQVQDGELDFCFIDGDHSYDGCMRDIIAWLPKVRPGGVLCGHDYELKPKRKFGVRQAVDEKFGDRVKTGAGGTWFVRI
jgi:hypothetical protein